MALLKASDSSAINTSRCFVNAVVFLDFEKAFDTVHHDVYLVTNDQDSRTQFFFVILT